MLVAAVLTLTGCDQGKSTEPLPQPAPRPVPEPPPAVPLDAPRGRTCNEVEPEYRAVQKAQEDAFDAALRDRGLRGAALHEIWIAEARDSEPGKPSKPTHDVREVVRTHNGARHRMLVTPPFDRAYARYRQSPIFVTDGKRNLWQVRKQLRPSPLTLIEVEACEWGCFGPMPSGMHRRPDNGRVGWLLADHTFKGEVVIEFTAPQIEFKNLLENCAQPP